MSRFSSPCQNKSSLKQELAPFRHLQGQKHTEETLISHTSINGANAVLLGVKKPQFPERDQSLPFSSTDDCGVTFDETDALFDPDLEPDPTIEAFDLIALDMASHTLRLQDDCQAVRPRKQAENKENKE